MSSASKILTAMLLLATGTVIGAVTQNLVSAELSSGDRLSYVSNPGGQCRLTDTRPQSAIGPRIGALGPHEIVTIQATGTSGDCAIPAGAAALSINVTAVGATVRTFLTFWPSGSQPLAASLNPEPGHPPTPNAVKVDLSDSGSFQLYNDAGFVHVVIDVDGWFEHHNHDDRYSRYPAGVTHAGGNQTVVLTANPQAVRSVTLTAPAEGWAIVTASGETFLTTSGHDQVACSITAGPVAINEHHRFRTDDSGAPTTDPFIPFSSTRTFPVGPGPITFHLVCNEVFGEIEINDSELTALYVPAGY